MSCSCVRLSRGLVPVDTRGIRQIIDSARLRARFLGDARAVQRNRSSRDVLAGMLAIRRRIRSN